MIKYVRGVNLVGSSSGTAPLSNYYIFNANSDVVQLANSSGAVTRNYHYDAFGYAGSIEFGHGFSNIDKKPLSWTTDKLQGINSTAFDNTTSWFFSCNTGTNVGGIAGTSFAQAWSNLTGGMTIGAVGFTDYGRINSPSISFDYLNYRKERFDNGGYSLPYPSFRGPTLWKGAKWGFFTPQ